MSDEEKARLFKKALKEGLREWLDDQFATFGKWSAGAVAAAALFALVYFILEMNGWRQP